jgi:murein DD-endopeptidase MepM/ murein hydrolase activator NlpD
VSAPPASGQLPPLPSLPPILESPLLPPLLPGLLGPASPTPAASPSAATSSPKASDAPVPAGDYDEFARCGPVPKPVRGPRSRPNNTKRLVALAQPLLDRGVPLDQAMIAISPPFPVAGRANFTDDWMNPRTTPCPHLHMGTDIFADFGTPIVASEPGIVNARGRHPVGGLSVWVTGQSRMSYYYAHLERFADIAPGTHVEAGTVLGYVGDTGNAEGGAPHLHFSLHPPKGKSFGVVGSSSLGRSLTPYANPKPYLDQWLTQSEIRAPLLVEELGRRVDADPASASRLASLLRPGDLAGFAGASGAGPFGLPWSRLFLIAAGLGLVAVVQALVAIGRSSKARRTTPAEEAGVSPAWTPSWAAVRPAARRRWRASANGHPDDVGRVRKAVLRQKDFPATERPPTPRARIR